MPLIPFSLTFVEYEMGDALGWLAALITLAPVFWIVSLCASLAQRRDLGTAAVLAGQLANEALNWVLKRVLAQPRPAVAAVHAHPGPAFGMPSNHAQFAGFAAASVCAWAASGRSGCGGGRRGRAAAHGAAVVALVTAAAVGASRVYLRYHSMEQVAVGWVVGAAAGAAWAALIDAVARPHFARITAAPLARGCGVRDASRVDVLRIEYEAVVAAATAAKEH